MTANDTYMHRCLSLAWQGIGSVAPNPMVGAVLVHKNQIIGEGYHRQYGQSHAEVNCLGTVANENQQAIKESKLYVSLEPCAHFGKTPPCVDLIIKHQIPEVVVGCRDSYSEVNGRGIEKLKSAGIRVHEGILEKECRLLNKRFFSYHELKRPYIILKWAESSDGRIAGEDDRRIFISNEFSNRLVHKWRSEESSVLVGTNTAFKDDPALTTRLWPGNDPVRLVIDQNLKLPASLRLFNKKVRTIIFNQLKQEEDEMISFYKVDAKNMAHEIVKVLYQLNIQSVLIEGGAGTINSFVKAGLWDEARVIKNTTLVIGRGIGVPILNNEVLIKEEVLGNDKITYFSNQSLHNNKLSIQ